MAIKKESDAAVQAAENVETVIKESVTVETAESVQKEQSAGASGAFCVYLGPSIRGVIQSGTIFDGDKDKAVAFLTAAVEKYPLIAALIVPGATIAEDRVKVKTPGNLLYVNYRKLASGKSK